MRRAHHNVTSLEAHRMKTSGVRVETIDGIECVTDGEVVIALNGASAKLVWDHFVNHRDQYHVKPPAKTKRKFTGPDDGPTDDWPEELTRVNKQEEVTETDN